MKSNQLHIRQFVSEFGDQSVDTESIFMKMHQGKDGKTQPIVSMGDGHLLNTIRLMLVKKPQKHLAKFEAEIRAEMLSGYAPADMDNQTRISLGLKKITTEKEREVQEKMESILDTCRSAALNTALKWTMPYLIVAFTRETTFMEAREILVEATGISQQIDLPEYTSYPVMSEREVLELTGGMGEGLVGIDDVDYNPLGFGEDPEKFLGDLG